MDIRIEELSTSIDAVDGQSLLTPAILARIVAAVRAELRREEQACLVRGLEMDLRSVVERQREPLGTRAPGVSDA